MALILLWLEMTKNVLIRVLQVTYVKEAHTQSRSLKTEICVKTKPPSQFLLAAMLVNIVISETEACVDRD